MDNNEKQRMQLHEERLAVEKRQVQAGEVNVQKKVVEEQQEIDVPVEKQQITVERVRVERGEAEDGEPSELRTEPYQVGDNWHIPIVEEKIVVTKKKVITEEIIIKKNVVQDIERVTETVRKEVAEIDEQTNGRGRSE